jgi:hypothetical protein
MSYDEGFVLPGSLSASPSKSFHGSRYDRSDDLFTADDVNDDLDPRSGARNEQPAWEAFTYAPPNPPSSIAPSVVCPALPVMQPVVGRPGLRMSIFSSSNIEKYLRKRARCGVLMFPDVPPNRRMEFVDETVNKLFLVYVASVHSYGFRVKTSTFFTEHGRLWIALTSWDSQPFSKWQKVFAGLNAQEIIIPYTGRDFPGPSRSSLAGVLDAFKETSIEELAANQIFYHEDEVRMLLPPGCAFCPLTGFSLQVKRFQKRPQSPPPGERARKASPSPAQKRARQASPSKENRTKGVLTTPKGRAAASDSPPTQLKGRGAMRSIELNGHAPDLPPAKLFSSPRRDVGGAVQQLSDACVAFLTNPDLSGLQAHYRELSEYLARDAEYGFIGRFLLSGCMTDIFVRTLHMRLLVRSALHHRFNMRVPSLYALHTIADSPAFAAMDGANKQALQLISYIFEGEQRRIPLFSLVEPVKRVQTARPNLSP